MKSLRAFPLQGTPNPGDDAETGTPASALRRRLVAGAAGAGILGASRAFAASVGSTGALGFTELPDGALAEQIMYALPGKVPLIKKTYRPPNFETPIQYFRQAITPGPMQGRMNATMRFIVWGTIPLGQIVGGAIATALSIPAALWIGGIGAFLAVIPLVITPVRSLRDMPEPVDAEAPTGPEVAVVAEGGPTA